MNQTTTTKRLFDRPINEVFPPAEVRTDDALIEFVGAEIIDGEYGPKTAICFSYAVHFGSEEGYISFTYSRLDYGSLDTLPSDEWADSSWDVDIHTSSDAWDTAQTIDGINAAQTVHRDSDRNLR